MTEVEILEKVLEDHERHWWGHLPEGWYYKEALTINQGLGNSSSVNSVYNEHNKFVGCIVTQQNSFDFSICGFSGEVVKDEKDAQCGVLVNLIGVDGMREYLAQYYLEMRDQYRKEEKRLETEIAESGSTEDLRLRLKHAKEEKDYNSTMHCVMRIKS